MSIVLQVPAANGGYVAVDTVALMEIEQEVARRTGPFRLIEVTNPQSGEPPGPASTTTQVVAHRLLSSMTVGGYEDMFVLRRGRFVDGTRLPLAGQPFVADDRIRTVARYDPANGVLEVDRPYSYAPYDGEEVELHHLEPEAELRPAVLGGLRRCFVVDRFPLETTNGSLYQAFDLTAVAPWITSRDQVYDVDIVTGAPAAQWQIEPYAGGLTLRIGEWNPGSMYVVNRRPAPAVTYPYPNGNGNGAVVRAGSVNEPWDDDDRFPISMDYGAAAGHIECWRSARPRMTLLAQTGMWPEQKEVAAEFTRVSTANFDPPRLNTTLPMWPRWWDSNLSNVR